MTEQHAFRWWEVRAAQNLKPTTYICPLCDQQLHAVSEHMLLLPRAIRAAADTLIPTASHRRAARASSSRRTSGARPGHPRPAHAIAGAGAARESVRYRSTGIVAAARAAPPGATVRDSGFRSSASTNTPER